MNDAFEWQIFRRGKSDERRGSACRVVKQDLVRAMIRTDVFAEQEAVVR
jgi:hypothetical protein